MFTGRLYLPDGIQKRVPDELPDLIPGLQGVLGRISVLPKARAGITVFGFVTILRCSLKTDVPITWVYSVASRVGTVCILHVIVTSIQRRLPLDCIQEQTAWLIDTLRRLNACVIHTSTVPPARSP